MNEEVNISLLCACVGAATTAVVSEYPVANRHDDFVFNRIIDRTFAFYNALKMRVDEYNAQVNAYWEAHAAERHEQLEAQKAAEQVLAVHTEEPAVVAEAEVPHQGEGHS